MSRAKIQQAIDTIYAKIEHGRQAAADRENPTDSGAMPLRGPPPGPSVRWLGSTTPSSARPAEGALRENPVPPRGRLRNAVTSEPPKRHHRKRR
jgi:hypothetical protein